MGKRGWFQDDSSTQHLLDTLLLLLLHQLHLKSSGIRPRRLGTPALNWINNKTYCVWGKKSFGTHINTAFIINGWWIMVHSYCGIHPLSKRMKIKCTVHPWTTQLCPVWVYLHENFFDKYSICIFVLQIFKLNVGESLCSIRSHNMWNQIN